MRQYIVLRYFLAGLLTALLVFAAWHALLQPRLTVERDEYRERAERILSEVMEGVEEVRNLTFTKPVGLQVVSKQWVEENWGRRSIEAEAEEVKLEEEVYRALYILPENTSLVSKRMEQVGWILAATVGEEIYVVREYFDLSNEAQVRRIFAHELTHILQSLHLPPPTPKFYDEKQAQTALIEGDADLTADLYMERWRGVRRTATTHEGAEKFEDPLGELKLFPYRYGEAFVEKLFEYGGWGCVNEAYERMPKSTTEVMHPEKYLSGWRVCELWLWRGVDGGWRRMKSERYGEYFIFVMLGAHIPIAEAREAAEGWLGDNFTYFKKNSRHLFLWRILWESESDAKEFEEAFEMLLEDVGGVKTSDGCWRMPNQNLCFTRRGCEVWIVGASTKDVAKYLTPEAG